MISQMDVNLTHAIAANVTLAQASSQNSNIFTAFFNNSNLISFLSGVVVALIVAAINAHSTQKQIDTSIQTTKDTVEATLENTRATIEQEKFKMTEEERREKSNKMQQAYSELMGHKHMILQYNASYFSELIRSGFLTNCSLITATSQVDFRLIAEIMTTDISQAEKEMSKTINDVNEASMEFEIAREADKRCRELQLKIGEGYERLWVTIGLIKLLFSDAPELRTYIDPIEAGNKFDEFEKSISDRNLKFIIDMREKASNAVSGETINFKKMQDDAIELNEAMISELKSNINALELKINALLNYLETVMAAEH